MVKMVDSREGSATVAVANSGRDDIAQRLHLVLGEQLVPIRESLEAAGRNLAGLRERFSAMEAALKGLVAETGSGGHAVCAAKLGEARRAVEELAASSEAGRRLREDNAVLRRDLDLQRGRQGVANDN